MLHLTNYIPDHIEDVAFDWNGTLLNDLEYCVSVTNSLLVEHQLPHLTVERYREVFRFPVQDYYQDLGFDFVNHAFETVSNAWMARYNSAVLKLDLFDQSEELIRELHTNGVPCAILSAAQEKDIHDLLRHHRLDDCFHQVFGLDHSHATSKKQRGKELLECLGKPAEKVMLIGDTDHDFEVAHALGMEVLILADGHQTYERLSKLPCQVLRTRY
jgi:phosphoglycolate phosphatase